MRRLFLQCLILVALVSSAACGYSLAGRGTFLPAHIKVISVPTFKNLTSVYDVDRRVSERVRSELIGRGRYTVNDVGANAVIEGEILWITIAPSAFNDQRQATRYQLVMTAKIEFRDLASNKVMWANPAMQFREEYDNLGTTTDPTSFFGQDVNALDRLAAEFARTLVSAILEAF